MPPLSTYQKTTVDLFNSFGWIFFGIMYFDYKGKIPIAKEMRARIEFWAFIVIGIMIAISGFLITKTSWEVAVINGYSVVTYGDLISLSFSIISILLIAYLGCAIMNRERYVKQIIKRIEESSKK